MPRLLSLLVVSSFACLAACGGGGEIDESVPDIPYCDPVSDWDAEWTAFENEVLNLVNDARSRGHNCDSEGNFGPTTALTMAPGLRCAARVHSMDMSARGYFDHTNPDGEKPWDRFDHAGYDWSSAGENIAAGSGTAARVMEGWLDSDGHCANLMSPDFTEIGVGYFPTDGPYWTQTFARPRNPAQ
jgi:uncharacterized protein YkwD